MPNELESRDTVSTIDREKAEVYEILDDLFVRSILALVFALSFLVVLGFLLWKPSLYIALVETVLTPTTYVVVKHYFPLQQKRKPKKR